MTATASARHRPQRHEPRRAVRAPSDPIFDKPYEPAAAAEAPAWEAAAKAAAPPPARGPVAQHPAAKKKVGSLLGG